jgi:signal transduction histidine kinase/ligand-binding sensor domain-containing protein
MHAGSPQRRRARGGCAEVFSALPQRSLRLRGASRLASTLSHCAMSALLLTIPAIAQRASQAHSTSNLHQWASVTLFHGLPSDHVRAIAQDHDGTILLGTDAGLARYDGRRVQKIPSLLSRPILDVEFDQSGTAWIATSSGAARLIRGEAEPIRETDGDSIRAIATATGRVVLLGERSALYDCRVDAAGSLRIRTVDQKDSPLLVVDSGGNRKPLELTSALLFDDRLLVGTHSRGLLSFSTGEELGEPQELNSRPRPFFVETIAREREGRFWFGAQTGRGESGLFYASDLLRPVRVPVATGTVTALRFDQSGDLWVGTDDQGVFRFRDGTLKDHFTFENTAGGLRSDRIFTVFVDRESVVWFGTDRGACRYDPGGLSAETVSLDAESNVARVLYAASNGRLWCGTNRGLFLRDQNGSWNPTIELRTKTVHSIAEDGSGRLLVGTASGLFAAHKRMEERAAGSNDQFVRVADDSGWNVRAICSFRGSVFAGSFGRGLDRVDGNRRTLIWPDKPGKPRNVVSLHADNDRLWIGTDAGVFVYDGQRVSPAPGFSVPADAVVWSLEGSLDNALWLATSRGLYVYRGGRLDPVIENCDARYVVRASPATSDMAWCATAGCGLFKVRLMQTTMKGTYEGKGAVMISKIDTEQGLPSQNTFAVATGPGEGSVVWIGTNRGVASYRPGGGPPLLAVSGAMAGRYYMAEEVLPGLVLDYHQSFAIDMAASSSRTFPEQFQYVFTFRDSRGQPVSGPPTRIPRVTSEVLPPGKYWEEVRAYNVDLVESDPVAVEITIEGAPFPWTSTALGTLLALALVALGWGWRQNRKLSGTNRELAETRFQLAHETETERRRIARDLHDQTLADLRRLMLMADSLPEASRNGKKTIGPAGFREEIDSISGEIRRICEDLSPSALANVGLAAALEWALADAIAHQPVEKRFEYEFACDGAIEERLKLSPAEQIQVYRIVQEALSNICRHSAATQVRLEVAVDAGGDLRIELEDNGCGFDASKSGKVGRGLTNIRSRASLIEASANWSASPGGGTIFTLRKTVVGFVVRS